MNTKSKKDMNTSNQPKTNFPIVGIGASAGGLAAFEAFFSNMPDDVDPNMAFVLIQHLAPDYKSMLANLVKRFTHMNVYEVKNGMEVEKNCVYVIPPNVDMAILNGRLQLLEPAEPHGHRLPINYFFESLAQDQKEGAIGIILSGNGADGTLGVRAIKSAGGLVMVQSPDTTEYDSMPQSAVNTGVVDFQLSPADMPEELLTYSKYSIGKLPQAVSGSMLEDENAMKMIFVLLRAQTKHDFSNYKSTTIQRRIERRMAVHQINDISLYCKLLQQTPAEVDALFLDLLIGVTKFFRDPKAFEALEVNVIPKLFENRPVNNAIRIWSAGCSTGEEAYSLAMLLQERIDALEQNFKIQVFATDIDKRAITTARAGVFPASIVNEITPDRLQRFFTLEADTGNYLVNKNIRDMLIFSEHNVIRDPPFSRLDMISCRNLLIYMNKELQGKLIPVFHYSLNMDGTLFLGTSECVDEYDDLFMAVDRQFKIYQRKNNSQRKPWREMSNFFNPLSAVSVDLPRHAASTTLPKKQSPRELTEQALLQQLAPASALVNSNGNILYLYGRTGMYLEPAPGESGVNNIIKMAREGLRPILTTLLHKVVMLNQTERAMNVSVKTNGHFTGVNLTICPVASSDKKETEVKLYLVMFEDVPEAAPGLIHPTETLSDKDLAESGSDINMRINALQQQLQAKDDYLLVTQEKLKSSNDELKCANEEMQSINEELQSTNEEMETSKEELQSVNEELSTVNAELQTKVAELTRANNDMNNMLAGTGIGTVFVDHQLRIMRFTPAASKIINLLNSDVGRPVSHIATNLVNYDKLVEDTEAVLETLVSKEIDVQNKQGNWYTIRIQPYRTLANMIEGAVITFADVTALKTSEASRESVSELNRLGVVVRDSYDAITVQDINGRILAWNPSAERIYGWSEAEACQMNVRDLIPPERREQELAELAKLTPKKSLKPIRTQRLDKNGNRVDVIIVTTALVNAAGQMYAISSTEHAVHK